ncbi:MAG: haloacid dehalogenase [Candidatus Latescibacterota bacterium]|nr:MAG: haloacid dehalogenase [Candidatus Latescibacterota bacterium]RKY71804.1 MAG: haloacid dehalogenase [Candidatus Latescibacterota bacterium]HDN67653.1 HAD family hydrolase [Bacillota bacterium]
MRFKTNIVIFDLDGTLIDSSPDIVHCANLALRELGLSPITIEQAKKGIGPGSEKFTRMMLPRGEENRAEEFLRLYRSFYIERCTRGTRLYPGVKDVLERLGKFTLVLTTNKPRYMAEKILRHFGLWEYFGLCLGPEDVSNPKPDPEMICKALNHLGEVPQTAMVVGDTCNDILAGKRAGTKTCAVTYGYSSRQLLQKEEPDFIIDRLTDLIGLLDGEQRTF